MKPVDENAVNRRNFLRTGTSIVSTLALTSCAPMVAGVPGQTLDQQTANGLTDDLQTGWFEEDTSNMRFYISKNLPIVQIRPKAQGNPIAADEILSKVAQWKESGVSIELSGHFVLSEDLEFKGYRNLQVVGRGMAIIEQQRLYNDASPIALADCTNVTLSNLILLGTGKRRSDGTVSEQNGIRVTRSRQIHIEKCTIAPVTETGTIKHGISVMDDSHFVWIKDNRIVRVTGSGVIIGTGIYPHPTESKQFDGHMCENIHIEGNDFEQVGVAVNIDDQSALCWIARNRIKLHYGEAIGVEDGSKWFVVTDNICGPGRGPAVLIGHGQTEIWGSRGVIANNLAAGCNDVNIAPPSDVSFYQVEPYDIAFYGRGEYLGFSNNIDVFAG